MRSGWLVLAVLVLAFMSIGPTAVWITDLWWFTTLGYESVFWLIETVTWSLALGTGLIAFATVYVNLKTAFRNTAGHRPSLPREVSDNPLVVSLQDTDPKWIAMGGSLLVSVIVGAAAGTWWTDVLLVWYGGDFGYVDPVFGLDARVYTFLLPIVLQARATLMGLVVICGVGSLGVYVARGAVTVELTEIEGQFVASGLKILPDARRHLAALVGSSLLLFAVGVALARFEMLYSQGGLFAGPGYADIWWRIPLMTVQAALAAVAAGAGWRAIDKMSAGWGVSSMALIALPAIAVWALPGVVQNYNVLPNELVKEGPQLVQHIEATRFAFDLDGIEELPLSGEESITLADLQENKPTIDNIRLWDHAPLLATFGQVQEIRTYYEFGDVDNDRYVIDGELRQIMLSPRELPSSSLPVEARTFVNQRMTYTHGHGMALGPVNEVTEQGLPKLFIKDLPPSISAPELAIDRPEIYFGESMGLEVFVNTDAAEFDHPQGDENVYTTYAGEGGVPIGTFGRMVFALRLSSTDMLFSQDIRADSKVLLYRDVLPRVHRLAPFLTLEPDPYMVIHEGRLVWILDAFTTSDRFPYSRRLQRRHSNYLRNSVKVTVDAYDGDVTFYRTDSPDPIADAWATALPELFRPISEMPEGLRAHIRYPESFFAVQANLYATYHMEDYQVFYNREDQWEVPEVSNAPMQPYYTVMTLPGGDEAEFIVMQPFNPAGKPNLAAWLVARNDGENYGQMRAYKFPKEKMVYGPEMIVARINQDDTISEKISLWNQQGSKVNMGTLLVIPIEESLIYVQPLYLESSERKGAIPELKRVIVAYENEIAMEQTLDEALASLFGRAAPPPRPTAVDATDSDDPAPANADTSRSWQDLSRTATVQWQAAQQAANDGDWAAWGQAIAQMGEALEALEALGAEVPEPQ